MVSRCCCCRRRRPQDEFETKGFLNAPDCPANSSRGVEGAVLGKAHGDASPSSLESGLALPRPGNVNEEASLLAVHNNGNSKKAAHRQSPPHSPTEAAPSGTAPTFEGADASLDFENRSSKSEGFETATEGGESDDEVTSVAGRSQAALRKPRLAPMPEEASAVAPTPRDPATGDYVFAGATPLEQRILGKMRERLEDDGGWNLSSKGPSEIYSRLSQSTRPGHERPLLMWRMRRELKRATARACFQFLLDKENEKNWNGFVTGATYHGRDHGALLISTRFKGVFPVSAREALEFRAQHEDADGAGFWIGYCSEGTAVANIPAEPKHERSWCCITGYRLKNGREPNTVDLTYLTHVDAGGNIPDWVMQKAGNKGGQDFFRDIQSAIDKGMVDRYA